VSNGRSTGARVRFGARVLGVVLAAVLASLAVPAAVPLPASALKFPSTADEVKLGASIAKEIESHYRIITDPAQVDRLQRVGDALAKVVERQDLTYHFKIVGVTGINALAVPGGWVYVTEGMMRFVRSDDELAAVLSHELTHINHRHYFIQQDREKKMGPAILAAIAISILARSPAPLLGTQFGMQAVMNQYQRDLEKDADLTGLAYLTKTQYSPVAMLTLMEHLAQVSRFNGQPTDVVVFQDHPLPEDRVAYIKADLEARHIPIIRRSVEGYLKIALDPAQPAAGAPVTIRVDGQPIVTIGAAVDGRSPVDRAAALAATLNTFFNGDPEPYDVRAVAAAGRWSVVGGAMVLFDVTPPDAAFVQSTPQALAEDIHSKLARVISAAPYVRKF
jgi:beta-barrel assembly-enhancing protease